MAMTSPPTETLPDANSANPGGLGENDPDHIAANPPDKCIDPKQHFQVGANQGKWLEYDDRGVPTKNVKKKKPTRKEKDGLEQEYLDAKKKYQQYLKDVEAWEQQKLDAESALEKSDKLRWAFRQIGSDKTSPILVEELEDLFRIMGWDQLTRKELGNMKKTAAEVADSSERLDLDALRLFTGDRMPNRLIEDRLNGSAVDGFSLEELYSPRTWRRKLEEAAENGGKKDKKEKKAKKDSASPRGSKSPRGGASPRGGRDGGASPRSEKKKKTRDDDSPRAASPRGGGSSPRGGKDKRDKKAKK